jgi:hypothetical protein
VLKDSLVFQIMVTDMTVLAMLCFYVANKPMVDKPNNFIQIFNECVISLCIVSMVVFTNFVPNPVDRYNYGYKLIYFIGASVLVNMSILAINIVKIVYKVIKKCLFKKKLTKHIKKVEKEQLELMSKIDDLKS